MCGSARPRVQSMFFFVFFLQTIERVKQLAVCYCIVMMEEKIYLLFKKKGNLSKFKGIPGALCNPHSARKRLGKRSPARGNPAKKKKTVNNSAANSLQSSDAKNFQSADTLFNISIGATHSSSLPLLLSAQGERAAFWLRRLPGGFSPTPSRLPRGFCFEQKEERKERWRRTFK